MNSSTPKKTIINPSYETTINWMIRFAHKDKKNLDIRRTVEKLLSKIEPGDYASEVLSIYYFVCNNIRYMRDISNVEFLKQPYMTLKTGSGDCDDIACLIAAMLMACGNVCRYRIIDHQGFKPPRYTHVFVEVKTPGGWVVLDPVAGKNTRHMIMSTTSSKVYNLKNF